MQIKITPRTLGGTEFTAQPARLHLGAQNAEGVDRLVFQLPAEWAGCSVTLHIRHSDGTLAYQNLPRVQQSEPTTWRSLHPLTS